MPESNLIPTETPDRPLITSATPEAVHITGEIKEEGVFASLVSSFRDVFFPEKLPPLVLESTPIAVPDLMATRMSRKSIAMSITFYTLLILLIAFIIAHHVEAVAPHKANVILTDMAPPPPPPVKPALQQIGGGGGAHDLAPAAQGHLPKFEKEPLLPPKAPPTIAPKLAVEPSVNVQPDIKMANNNMPNIGLPTSGLHGVSLGTGSGGGLGNGNGNGIGPGSGGNTGGGPMHIGGSVSPPQVLKQVDPEFSEEARKAKFSGNVEVYLWVDEQGNPSHVRVVRGVGMGLDEKAVDAVRQYKFKPAMQNGKPVKVDLYIDVNFQIF